MGWVRIILAAVLAMALLYAAWGDLRDRTIGNRLNAAVAIGAPLWWWATGLTPWPDVAIQIGIALAVFAIFTGCFAIGAMGGGDVKLIAALALWFPFARLTTLLMVMAIAGGVLTLVMLVRHRIARSEGQPEVPYGVAIAAAGLWVIANDILTATAH